MRLLASFLLLVSVAATGARADDLAMCGKRGDEMAKRAESFTGEARIKRLIEADLTRSKKEIAEGDLEECQEALDHAASLMAGKYLSARRTGSGDAEAGMDLLATTGLFPPRNELRAEALTRPNPGGAAHPGVPPLALTAAVALHAACLAATLAFVHVAPVRPSDPPVIELVLLSAPLPPEAVSEEPLPPPVERAAPQAVAPPQAPPPETAPQVEAETLPEPTPEPMAAEPSATPPVAIALSEIAPNPPLPLPEPKAPPAAMPLVEIPPPAETPKPPPPVPPVVAPPVRLLVKPLPPHTPPRPLETKTPPPKPVPARRETLPETPPPVARPVVARPVVARPVVAAPPRPVSVSPAPITRAPTAPVAFAPVAAVPARAAPVTAVTPPKPRPTGDQEASLEARVREAVQAAVRYPAAARMMGMTGRARVLLDYRSGAVGGPSLVQSSGASLLDEAALAAARNARYPAAPPELSGRLLRLVVWVEFRA